MIYTIGHTESYEQYFREQENPQKAVGGSVWKHWNRAWFHTRKTERFYSDEYKCNYIAWIPNGYSVYGVWAEWKWHVVENGNHWGDLLIDADLVKIRKEWGGTLA